MISIFKEDTSMDIFSNWSVFFVIVIVLIAIFLNFLSLFKKSKKEYIKPELESVHKIDNDYTLIIRHIGLSIILCLACSYGVSTVENSKITKSYEMISVIQKDNKVDSMRLLDNRKNIVCSKGYTGSIDAITWTTKQGKTEIGLLVGQKDNNTNTCRFTVEKTK